MKAISIRIWKKTHDRLRKRAFKERKPITQLLDELAGQKKGA